MVMTTEEADEIKEHLLKQLDNFPEDKRNDLKKKINSMNEEEIENFVQQNNLKHLGGQCIFCEIFSGKKSSIKVAENNLSIAILELNPLSKGHILIVPKEHSNTLLDPIDDMANQISNKLKEKFNPIEVRRNELEIMGHKLLEVIPIYGGESVRHTATNEELVRLKEELLSPPKSSDIKGLINNPRIPKFPPRIP
ncbi:MAG: HIT domain-containing protein [Nanoarchaeota archaeon]|nr:HIT domain-containing protein [Nanoarchaeota archaeon]